MQIAIIVFMILTGIVTIFTLVTVIMDMVTAHKKHKLLDKQIEKADMELENANAVSQDQVVFESPINNKEEQEACSDDKGTLTDETSNGIYVDENAIVINSTVKTLQEKYDELSPKYKGYYDSIANYAKQKEGVKQTKNTKQEVYKVGHSKIVTLKIRRDVVIAEFMFENQDFKDYVNGSNVKVEAKPTIVKILDEDGVSFAKGSIDIAYDAIPNDVLKRQLNKSK